VRERDRETARLRERDCRCYLGSAFDKMILEGNSWYFDSRLSSSFHK